MNKPKESIMWLKVIGCVSSPCPHPSSNNFLTLFILKDSGSNHEIYAVDLFHLLWSTFKNNETEFQTRTPKFLDVNSLKDVDEKTLRNAQNSAKDEFGVTHDTIKHFMNPNLMCPDPRINFSY